MTAGGKRPGSGRKKGEPTTTINFRVTVGKKEKIKAIPDLTDKFNDWTNQIIINHENTN